MSSPAYAASVINRAYNGGRNFITPYVDRFGVAGRYAYELSHGEGLGGGRVYGVTVVTLKGDKCPDLSECFSSLDEAEAHIKGLRRHSEVSS